METGAIETAIISAAPYERVAVVTRIPTERMSGNTASADSRRKPSVALGVPLISVISQPPQQEDWKQYMKDAIKESLADIMNSGSLASQNVKAAPLSRREERQPESPRRQRQEVMLPARVVRKREESRDRSSRD